MVAASTGFKRPGHGDRMEVWIAEGGMPTREAGPAGENAGDPAGGGDHFRWADDRGWLLVARLRAEDAASGEANWLREEV